MASLLKIKSVYYIFPVVFIILSYSVPFISSKETVQLLAREDGFQENATALWFLLAGLLFLYMFFRDNKGCDLYLIKTRKNIFFLLLGILFIFGFGEEISWGQRILNIETPEKLKEVNLQNELNFHNLTFFQGDHTGGEETTFHKGMLSMGRLFAIFWLSYCVLVPVLVRISQGVKKIVQRVYLPLVPLFIGVLFLFHHLIAMSVRHAIDPPLYRYITETRESLFAFLFFVVALWFLNHDPFIDRDYEACSSQ